MLYIDINAKRIEVQIMVEKLNQCYKGKILKQ